MALNVIDITQWVEENKCSFVPPVCNKLMYGGQLKIMFLGGPNQRKDYHIEEGEEFFFQLKGDMVLKVVEKGQLKDIVIKEGECYNHPCRIPHSPQRSKDTLGLVIERERTKDEVDGLRYYVEGATDPLWEKWFYCYDLGTQLAPVIKSFFESEEFKTGRPPPGKVFPSPPVKIDTSTAVQLPLCFQKWCEENKDAITKGSKVLFGNGEFKVVVWGGGIQEEENPGETFLWQMKGDAEVSCGRGNAKMFAQSCTVMNPGERFRVTRGDGSLALTITTDPFACKST